MNILKKVIKHYKRRRAGYKILKKYKEYMKNGIYYSNFSKTIFFNKQLSEFGTNEEKFLVDNKNYYCSVQGFIFYFLKIISGKSIKTKIKHSQGTVLMTKDYGRTVKIFDYDTNKLLSFYNDKELFDKTIDRMNFWSKYFNVPNYTISVEKKCIIENIIKKKEYDVVLAFPILIENYIHYLECLSKNQYLIFENIDNTNLKEFCALFNISMFYEKIKNIYEKIPMCLSHGDYSPYNIMYDGNEYWYIDFEFLNYRKITSDLFQYIFATIHLKKNYVILEHFLNGKYDDVFSELYKVCKTTYLSEEKHLYILIFIYEWWNNFYDKKMSDRDIETLKNIVHNNILNNI